MGTRTTTWGRCSIRRQPSVQQTPISGLTLKVHTAKSLRSTSLLRGAAKGSSEVLHQSCGRSRPRGRDCCLAVTPDPRADAASVTCRILPDRRNGDERSRRSDLESVAARVAGVRCYRFEVPPLVWTPDGGGGEFVGHDAPDVGVHLGLAQWPLHRVPPRAGACRGGCAAATSSNEPLCRPGSPCSRSGLRNLVNDQSGARPKGHAPGWH